jgi:Flp pilus assembly protein TadD
LKGERANLEGRIGMPAERGWGRPGNNPTAAGEHATWGVRGRAGRTTADGPRIRYCSRASVGRSIASFLSVSSLLVPLAAIALAGCEPFPVHYDPLSINGRDGGGTPPSYEALMRIGAAALAGGDPVNALSVFRRAAEIKPAAPAPFVATGDALLQIGAVDEAILAYNSALARDDGDFAAQLGLARAYLETGRPELALVPLSKALAQSPNDPTALALMGVTKDLSGQHAAAQAAYRQGLKYAPTSPALTVNLALSLALSGDYPAAIDELEPVAMAPAGSAPERQNLALIYGLQGNDVEAARIGRIDLDQASVEHNLAYYRTLRQLPPDALSRAILRAGISRPNTRAS